MKMMTAILTLVISSTAMSATITGQVKKFSGMTVESRRPYSYYALQTSNGRRLILPSWIKAEAVAKMPHQISFNGDISVLMCTDMSAACASGHIKNIKSFQIGIGKRLTDAKTFKGKLVEFSGRAVTTGRAYKYVAVDSKSGAVALPSFLDEKVLLAEEVNADYTLVGKTLGKACSDMSKACGAAEVSPLSSLSIQF